MNRTVLYRFVSAMLIAGIAAQGILIAKPADVSNQKTDSHHVLCAFSDTTALFLSLQNSPKTRGAFPAVAGCSPVGLQHGSGLWNTLHEYTVNSGGHTNSLCQTAAPETLYALHCQFTI